jgi:hypothetical protein
MSQNKVQFQKSYSLLTFGENFSSEHSCLEYLVSLKLEKGFCCLKCGNKSYCRLKCRPKVLQCNACNSQVSITSGSMMENSNLPLKKWFYSILLISQSKNGISALELSRQIEVPYKTAWLIKHKIMQAMMEKEGKDSLLGRIEVDDAYLGGKRSGSKRGRGASGKTPFIAAVQTTPDKKPDKIKLRVVAGFRKNEVEQWMEQFIGKKSSVLSDGLACFRVISEHVKQHQQEIMYNNSQYQTEKAKQFKWVNTVLGNLKNALKGTYKSVKREYTQRYLSEFEYRFNRRYDLKGMFRELTIDLLKAPPMKYELITLAVNK